MAKKESEHFDVLGRLLKVGDPVAVANTSNTLLIGQITALTPKQIRVVKYGSPAKIVDWRGTEKWNGRLRYPSEAVLLEGSDLLMYLLKTL